MSRAFCPNCGHDLQVDGPIMLNNFSMVGSAHQLLWRGAMIRLTPMERSIVWSVMKLYPEPVTTDVLLERMGSEGDRTTIAVLMSRIRSKLRAVGAPDPFQCVRHRNQRAYVWTLI